MTDVVAARWVRAVALAVALCAWVAAAGPAAGAPAGGRPPGAGPPRAASGAVPGEVIVKWTPQASASSRAGARGQLGIAHRRSAGRTGVELHAITSGRSPEDVALELSRDPRVAYAQPNNLLQAFQTVPDDPAFGGQWGLRNTGQTIEGRTGTPGIDIDLLDAWTTTRGDDAVVVAVIDEGTDRHHPDLQPNMWVNPQPGSDPRYPDDVFGWDFLNDDNTVFDPEAGEVHGTHVSGTIAAVAGNGIGVAGVAPEVTVLPLKFLGTGGGSTMDAIDAIEYAADRGVRVVNASWGAPGPDPALRDAVAASGMAFIAAAGNAGSNNDAVSVVPCTFGLPNVLCVTAVDNRGSLPGYANYGATTVHVGAPGSSVLSTVPRDLETTVALDVDPAGAGYKATYWGFDLSDVVGPDDRAQMLASGLSHLDAGPTTPILLVDDDESARNLSSHPDARPVYQQALDASGYTDVTVRTVAPDQAGPTAAEMAGRTVVWFTGQAFGNPAGGVTTLTTTDRTRLTTFLDGGGRLLLAGADAIYGIENTSLVRNRLHAAFVREVSGRGGLEGQPGTAYAGDTYALVANPAVKHVRPASTAATAALTYPEVLTYGDAYSFLNGTSMAAPHATGVAALVATLRPDLTGSGIVALLKDTVTPLPSLHGRTATGGMVNAANAVAAAFTATTVPGAPTGVSAVPGDRQATVTWSAPAADGGTPISGYTVTAQPGGTSVSVGSEARQATVRGLSNGQAYTFAVRAINAVGAGPPSAPTVSVTPRAAVACPPGTVPSAGFADVGIGNVHAPAIDCAAWYGLAQGTSPTTFGPAAGVRRDQMASFIARLIEEAGITLQPSGAPFTDIAGNTHEARINQLAGAGIVQGTRPGTYAPRAAVTRDQMAAFLTRAYELIADRSLPAPPHGFTDVAGNAHEVAIAKSAGAGFAFGTTADTYGPRGPVRRDQMASFLTRVLQRLVEEGLADVRS